MSSGKCILGSVIGQGAYGTTYLSDGDSVIKIPSNQTDKLNPTSFGNISYIEIDILSRFNTNYIVKCLDIYLRRECGPQKDIGLKLERCTGLISSIVTSFDSGMGASIRVSYRDIKQLFLTACFGIRSMHREQYLHLDLSEGNLLYKATNKGIISVIIDPGIGAAVERYPTQELMPLHTMPTKITYTSRPPECFKNSHRYTDKADVWSLGILFLAYFRGVDLYTIVNINSLYDKIKAPTEEDTDNFMLSKITELFNPSNVKSNIHKFLTDKNGNALVRDTELESLIDLLSHMLDIDPITRYNIENVIDHEYFSIDPSPIGSNFKRQIQHEFGDNYTVKIADPLMLIGPDYTFTGNKIKGINFVFKLLTEGFYKSIFYDVGVYTSGKTPFMCLSIDLYMRFMSGVGPHATEDQCCALAFLATRMSFRLYQDESDIRFTEYRNLTKPYMALAVEYEGPCLKLLEGNIRSHFYYTKCETLEEIAIIIDDIFLSDNMLLQDYLRIDFDNYISDIRSKYKTLEQKDKTPKYANIEDLIEKIKNIKEYKKKFEYNVIFHTSEQHIKDPKTHYFYTMIVDIGKMYPNFPFPQLLVSIDLYLLYINTINPQKYNESQVISQVCATLPISDTYKDTNLIPEVYKSTPNFDIYTDDISKSNAYQMAKQNRIYLASNYDELLCKAFIEYILDRKNMNDEFQSLSNYKDWNLPAIMDILKHKLGEHDTRRHYSISEFI